MSKNLHALKQEAVREAISEAAMDLFAAKGFDQTTVEEVAQAAGVSRRSFFRYYEGKDDLLAQGVVDYGKVLAEAVKASPSRGTPLDVVHETVMAGAKYVIGRPKIREGVEIAIRSASARQAYHSRMVEVEDRLADAFASRLKGAKKDDVRPRLLAGLTLVLMNTTVTAWFMGEYKDIVSATRHAFASLSEITSDKTRLLKEGSVPLNRAGKTQLRMAAES